MLGALYARDHPYQVPLSGTEASVAGLTRVDLTEYHSRFLVAGRSTIVVAGDGGLVATFDGGTTWSTVAQVTGVADFGFTTPTQGVAVVPGQSPTLVTTHDGGHTWTTVTFP